MDYVGYFKCYISVLGIIVKKLLMKFDFDNFNKIVKGLIFLIGLVMFNIIYMFLF